MPELPDVRSAEAHDAARDHLLAVLSAAPVRATPFPHVHVVGIWPAPYYRALLQSLPPSGCYRPAREDSRGKEMCRDRVGMAGRRLEMWVDPDAPAEEGEYPGIEFLRQLTRRLETQQVIDAISGALDISGGRRASVRLVREEEAAMLLPHLDRKRKAFVAVFYLAPIGGCGLLGTSLYRMEGEDAVRMDALPFAPNSVALMQRTKGAWHGVDAHLCPVPRNTLHLYVHT